MAAVAAIKHAMKKKQEKQRLVEKHKCERRERERAQVDAWFDAIDTKHAGVLNKKQLAALLKSIDPDTPIEQSLKYLEFLGDVTKENIVEVVRHFRFFSEQRKEFDETLTKRYGDAESFDSGQVLTLMNDLAPQRELSATDAEGILHSCGTSQTIHRDDLLPALASWCQHKLEITDEEDDLHKTQVAVLV